MAELRCGVAGLRRGKLFVSVLDSLPQCKVVAVCDSNPEALSGYSGLSTHRDFDEFIREDMDVVAIVTPGPGHAGQSIQALERGVHVLCETPCVYSVQEANALVRAARTSGKRFMLAENYLWMGFSLALQDWHRQGMFGTIIYAEGDYTHDCRDIMLLEDGKHILYAERDKHPNAQKSWRAERLPPLTYCSHTLGPLLALMGDRVCSAVGLSAGSRTAPELGAIDLESALLQTEGRSVIRLTNGFTVAHPMALHYKVVGTRGSALVQRMDGSVAFFYSDASRSSPGKWERRELDLGKRPDGRDSVAVMAEEFVLSILDDRPPPLDVYSSLEMVVPGVLAHESALQGGKRIEVPDLRAL